MDNNDHSKEILEDVTRESLIAIAYTEPQKEPVSGHSPANLNGPNNVKAVNGDGQEKYRSELISISYSQSPDPQALPVLAGDYKG